MVRLHRMVRLYRIVRLYRMVAVAFIVCAGFVASVTPAQAVTFTGSCPGNNYLTIWLDASASYSVNGAWPFAAGMEQRPGQGDRDLRQAVPD